MIIIINFLRLWKYRNPERMLFGRRGDFFDRHQMLCVACVLALICISGAFA